MVRVVSLSASSKPAWLVSKSVSTYCKETIVQITTPLISSTRTYSCRLQNHVTSPPFITTFTDPIVLPKHIPKWRKRNIHTNLYCIRCEQNEHNSNSKKNTKIHFNNRLNSVIVRCDIISRISKSPLSSRLETLQCLRIVISSRSILQQMRCKIHWQSPIMV